MSEEGSQADADPASERMMLSNEERRRAKAVKNLLGACHITGLSDLECVQLATIHFKRPEMKPAEVEDVARKLVAFKARYKIRDTTQDGIFFLSLFQKILPNYLMDVSYLPSEERYTLSFDYAKLLPGNVKEDDDYRIFMGGAYYIAVAVQSNISAIRNGVLELSECEGMGMANLDFAFEEKFCREFFLVYPVEIRETNWVHPPKAAIMLFGIFKRILPGTLTDGYKLMNSFEGYEGRIDKLFTTPTPEVAQQALLKRIEIYLTERFHQQQTFSLEDNNDAMSIG